ncbi:hypothetical protein ACQKIE_00970 [Luteibacter sp. NPDC031894]|uniref:hypothetical protein n=1 Tax=Luteibacter sp. NPDC031894 TaxID=3390572 RepID=UPI003D011EDC
MNALATIAPVQQGCLKAIDDIGHADAPSSKALRELFVDLWTRCSEASFRASVIAGRPSVQADRNILQTLRNIEEICSVEAIYRRMHVTLNEMQAVEDREIDRLRERCAFLAGENAQLRAKAGAA